MGTRAAITVEVMAAVVAAVAAVVAEATTTSAKKQLESRVGGWRENLTLCSWGGGACAARQLQWSEWVERGLRLYRCIICLDPSYFDSPYR